MRVVIPGLATAAPSGSDAPSSPVVLAVGQPAPPLVGVDLDGRTVDLAALRGRPVIVNFWGSWCTPCRDEFPLLAAGLDRHRGDGLAIIGVLFKDDPGPARAFIARMGAGWPSVADPDGAFARAYRVVAPPQTYFIDRDGVVRSFQVGEVADAAELEAHLAEILR